MSYGNWTASATRHLVTTFTTTLQMPTAGAFRGGRNVTSDVLTAGESFDAAADVSTRFLESGDFVRFKTPLLVTKCHFLAMNSSRHWCFL